MIDDLRKLVFCHASRTGGTSVETMMAYGRAELIHNSFEQLREAGFRYWGCKPGDACLQHYTLAEMGGLPPGYHSFATIRNPYFRAASMLGCWRGQFGNVIDMINTLARDHRKNWVLPQFHFAEGADRLIRICDGEREGVDWLENVSGQQLRWVNQNTRHCLTPKERDFVRNYYSVDFVQFQYPDDYSPTDSK